MTMELQRRGLVPPTTWSLGGRNEKNVDIPASAVFLALFIGGAAAHMTIFQLNRRKGHKFLFSALLFGFCMARIVTMIMRISSAALPKDLPLAIASQIFTAAGVVIIFIVNLVFVQRLIRASHPTVGWSRVLSAIFKFLYVLIILTIIMVIIVVVQSFYTRSIHTHSIDHDIMRYGVTTFAVISFLPIPMTIATVLIPRRNGRPIDKFGHGRWRYKAIILLTGATLVSFGACYRAATVWLDPVPVTQALPAVLGKGPFYVANFTVEIITVYLYAISRVDKRFHVPDGAKQHRNYQRAAAANSHMDRTHETPETKELPDAQTSVPTTSASSPENELWQHLRDSDTEAGSNIDIEKHAGDKSTIDEHDGHHIM